MTDEPIREDPLDAGEMTQEQEQAYAEYLMEHHSAELMICNGDRLIMAMEDGKYYDDFVKHWRNK